MKHWTLKPTSASLCVSKDIIKPICILTILSQSLWQKKLTTMSYGRRFSCCSTKLEVSAISRVFVNRSLMLEKVKYFGFDMDYTLAGKYRFIYTHILILSRKQIIWNDNSCKISFYHIIIISKENRKASILNSMIRTSFYDIIWNKNHIGETIHVVGQESYRLNLVMTWTCKLF